MNEPLKDGDRVKLDSILVLLEGNRPQGFDWPGVARLIRRVLNNPALPREAVAPAAALSPTDLDIIRMPPCGSDNHPWMCNCYPERSAVLSPSEEPKK